MRPSENVLLRRLSDGESVILNLSDERYYGLNASGTLMWEALVEHGSVSDALASLLEIYEVDAAELRADLAQLVSELESAGLMHTEHTSGTS